MRLSGLFCLLLIGALQLNGQVEVRVTVLNGSSTTNCIDILSAPDPLWQVNIDNEGWETYPMEGFCFNDFPNLQYQQNYNCPADVPAQIEVCFKAFENDALFPILCQIDESCSETICQMFAIPALGGSATYTLELPDGLSSDGEVTFLIENTSSTLVDNDLPCTAYDFGLLSYSAHLGDATLGGFSNACATNNNEPNPFNNGFFINDAGVWFTFTTGPDPSGEIYVRILSDPLNTGDDFDAEILIYTSSDGTCNGSLSNLINLTDNLGLDGLFRIYCPSPNTTYYVLVDGGYDTPTTARGAFGIEVVDIGVREGADLRCNATDLGVVPDGGSVQTDSLQSNFCATATGDPFVGAFVSQHSVWFRFVAPSSGHVVIEALSDRLVDSIGLQLALYRSTNNLCTGFFSNTGTSYTFQDLDETFEVSCLYAGTPYWILVDGDGANPRGSFTISVTDAGDITPVTTIDTVLCFGQSLTVGTSIYTQSGNYADTLQVFAGCDSIVISNVTVLTPVQATATQTFPAIGLGDPSGMATVSASGGAGNYTYLWCSGETGPVANQLPGGQNCCVTVTDANGCEAITCFDVDYVMDVIPLFENDTLLCFGDQNGQIIFSVLEGLAPYNYSWQNAANTLSGTGVINAEGQQVIIPDLPAGTYTFTVADAYSDSTFVAVVVEPAQLTAQAINLEPASCFGVCDGAVDAVLNGGTGAYQLQWSNGATTNSLSQLCASTYILTVTDANNCTVTLPVTITEPAEFIATAQLTQAVSCFEGADGIVNVTTNGVPVQYQWSNGAMSATVSNLPAGFYDVTVTNSDGCQDFAGVQVTQPAEPLSVSIDINTVISCAGDANGALVALPDGPYVSLVYNWNTGDNTAVAAGLPTGQYAVTITNEKNCEADTSFFLDEPTAVNAELSAQDITCTSGPNGGAIQINSVSGGTPPYQFSINDRQTFTSTPAFLNLFEGAYNVIVRDAAGCEQAYSQVVNGPPVLEVTLGDDFDLQLGDTATIEALATSVNLAYKWTPEATAGTPAINVSPIISTLYTVEVFDSITLCRASDAVFVTVIKDRPVFIPNAFSPNDDGRNDLFVIFGGTGIAEVKSFRIFSRSGAMIFERTNFQPNDPNYGWGGDWRGQPANTGVYVYLVEITFVDGQTEVFKGDVTLLR